MKPGVLTVKELKQILEQYDDRDLVVVSSRGCDEEWSSASLYVAAHHTTDKTKRTTIMATSSGAFGF